MPVGIGAGRKCKNPLRPKTENRSPKRSREMRTNVFIVWLGSKSGLVAAVEFRVVEARDGNEADENEGDGDHGVGFTRW
jgi:hypothetical protein